MKHHQAQKQHIMEYWQNNHHAEDIYEPIRAYFRKHKKLDTFDYLNHIKDPSDNSNLVEVRFKNTHKAFYSNSQGLSLKQGDIVAVESPSGHDIGMVSLTGLLAKKQYNRKIRKKSRYNLLAIYRKARASDVDRWIKAKKREIPIRNRAREIAKEMGLDMKISDAEFQGDGTRVTLYYVADKWIDFRDLVKHYAVEFQVKIEMKQIGARQEAAMIGGFSSCGHEMCGSRWQTNIKSVKISAAKIQQLPCTDTKLMDHSGKLKSCLNFELDTYQEAWKDIPDDLPEIITKQGTYYPQKIEVLKHNVWYSANKEGMVNPVVLSVEQIKQISSSNKAGKIPSLKPKETENTMEKEFLVGSSKCFINQINEQPKNMNRKSRQEKSYPENDG